MKNICHIRNSWWLSNAVVLPLASLGWFIINLGVDTGRCWADENALTARGTTLDENEFKSLRAERVDSMEVASIESVRAVLHEPVIFQLRLSELAKDPRYEFTDGWVKSVFEQEVASPQKGKLLSMEAKVDYWRKLAAVDRLRKGKDSALSNWMLRRKDVSDATLLDALIVLALGDHPMDLAGKDGTNAHFRELFLAKNPMCRVLAVKGIDLWATNHEISAFIRMALTDDYWYTRSLALDVLDRAEVPERKAILEEFFTLSVDDRLPDAFREKEAQLKEKAHWILRKAEGQTTDRE